MTTSYCVAVLGATGMVGQAIMDILAERQFPVSRLKPLASQRTAGQTITFNGQPVVVEEATPEAFEGVDIVLSSAGAAISEKLVPEAVKRGAVVVDNTSFYRMHDDVPLVVVGVNDADVKQHTGIIANPNCSTSQLVPVLKQLHEAAGLKRVVVSTYQSVSGAGKDAMDELHGKTGEYLNSPTHTEGDYQVFAKPMAFNVLPHIDVFLDNGYTKEEWKVVIESRKMLHLPDLAITCTAVRVPVLIGHSEAVTVTLNKRLTVEQAADILSQHPEIEVSRDPKTYHTPREIAGLDPVYVSRLRVDSSDPTGHTLSMWVVADNLRIGAALNTVKIAETLVKLNCVKPQPVA